jgi:hypothetical protein
MTRRGGAGKGSGNKGRRGAEHGQACTKQCTGAVAVRAAPASAVQVGQGDEGNRHAELGTLRNVGIRYRTANAVHRRAQSPDVLLTRDGAVLSAAMIKC